MSTFSYLVEGIADAATILPTRAAPGETLDPVLPDLTMETPWASLSLGGIVFGAVARW
jgi:hypothetical protein